MDWCGGDGPPYWICDVTSGRLLGNHLFPKWRPEATSPHSQDSGRKLLHHKSKIAAGSDVTTTVSDVTTISISYLEVPSQIQDGRPSPPHRPTECTSYTIDSSIEFPHLWPRWLFQHSPCIYGGTVHQIGFKFGEIMMPPGICLTHWGRDKVDAISRFLEWKYLNSDWNFTEVCS